MTMDTETPVTSNPAAADTGSPNGQQQQVTQQPVSQPQTQENTFAVPDAYKDRSWAGKVKSIDDVYKALDGAQELIGKKTITPIDYDTATPEEIAAYHEKLRPADSSAYEFGEGYDPEFSGVVADVFMENGINKHQGNAIIKKIVEAAGGIAGKQNAEKVSAKAYLDMTKARFGDDHEKAAVAINNTIKTNATAEDLAVFDNMDNATRIAVDQTIYNLSKGYEERIAKILKEHGVTETGSQAGDGGSGGHGNAATQRAEIRKQMRDLDGKPHSHAQMANLQQQLNALIGK